MPVLCPQCLKKSSQVFPTLRAGSSRFDCPEGHIGLGAKKGSGAAEGTRTPDPIITNDVLYQLSYSGLVAVRLARTARDV